LSNQITPAQQQEIQILQQMSQQLNVVHQNYLQLESKKREIQRTVEVLAKIEGESEIYQSVGQIMFKVKADDVHNELKEQLELIEIQVNKTRTQVEALDKQVKEREEKLRSTLQV